MVRSRFTYALALLAAGVGCIAAHASVVARHQGCTDPTSEDWTTLGSGIGVDAEPLCGGAGDAWRIDDNSTGGSLLYRKTLNTERLNLAMSVGWELRGNVVILDSAGQNLPFSTTHGLNFRSATRGYDLFLRLQSPTTLRVWAVTQYDLGGGALGISADVPINFGETVEVAMSYDPVAGTAGIEVAGNEVISNYAGAELAAIVCCQRGVSWGATQTSGTGEGRWSLVELDVNCDIPIGDITGDGAVNLTDLAILLAAFGLNQGDAGYVAAADLDGSNSIGLSDLALLLANFGSSCP